MSVDVTCTNSGTASDSHSVTVNADGGGDDPCDGNITGATSVTEGNRITLSWSHTSGQGTASSYSWTVGTGLSGSSTSSSITITGVTAGNRSVSVDVTCTNSGTASDSHSITVEEDDTGGGGCEITGVSGLQNISVGGRASWTASYTGTATSWVWESNDDDTASVLSYDDERATIGGENEGNTSIKITLTCGSDSDSFTRSVSVAGAPTGCISNTLTLSYDNARTWTVVFSPAIEAGRSGESRLLIRSGFAIPPAFVVSGPHAVMPGATSAIINYIPARTGTYYASLIDTSDDADCRSLISNTVTVETLPELCEGSITGATTVFEGSRVTLEWSHISGAGTASSYSWTVGTGLSGSSSSSTITVTGVTAGTRTVSITVTCTNGGSASARHLIIVSLSLIHI